MKILLIAINAKYIHSNPAVFSLKSCVGEYESYVDIIEFTINQQPSFILRKIYEKHPDVAAFSCYIWNRGVIDSIVPDLHKILPDTDVWAGGPEVSYNAFDVIARWKLRGILTGYGEGVFSHLVSAYVEGTADRLPVILDGNGAPRRTLDEIPFWYKDLSGYENRIVYYESSRGCPFSCSYCLSSIDKVMDFRSVERVCKELDFFLEKKVPQVKFVDRTFNCKKEHALLILRHLFEHDNGITNFHFEIAADLLDEDYFVLLEKFRPGAVQLEIGIQSTHMETILEIDRRMDFARVADAVRRILSWKNIHVHLDLIAGLPFEDFDTFQNSFNDVYALYPEQLQLGFLKVLKGSNMELRSSRYGLQYTDLPPYEVLSTRWLSYEEICSLKKVEEVLELYYNSGQFENTLHFLLNYFDTPYHLYDALAVWYEDHGLFGIQSSRVKKYEILLQFGIWHLGISTSRCCSRPFRKMLRNDGKNEVHCPDEKQAVEILRESVVYDLYLRENMKNRPSFAPSLECWKDKIHAILQEESKMHGLFPALSCCSYRELVKALHVEVFEHLFERRTAVLFSYEERSPLSNNCSVAFVPLDGAARA